MGTTKEIILDIEVNNKVAIDNIVKLTKQLEDLKVAQTQLDGAYKLGTKTAEEYDKENTALQAQIRNVKNQIREYNKEIDANIQKQEAQEGSLKQMRAELKNMVKEYDSLSAADRQSDMGANLRDNIKELTDQLKNLEGETGRFQRNVGDYRNAIKEALNGNINLKTALKELKTELQTLSFQQRQQIEDINKQKAALDELATTLGKDSAEYKKAEQDLLKMQKDYDDTTKSINDMSIAAGNMQDVLSDTSASIKNFGTDNANIKATAAGLGVLANSYTVLQAGMASLGAESEELVKVWAKVQLVQQGINAINQIANALEKESILRQQLRILTNKLLGKSMVATTAAKKADAAASVEAAAGDATLAAGETAATAAAGGLVVALKAVGAAIKSIPIVGWILAAVAGLATLTGLVIKHNREEKKNNELYIQRKKLMEATTKAQQEALEATQKQVVQLDMAIDHLKSTKSGTEEWKKACAEVATELGVDAEWLQKNVDKVDELRDAWVNLKIAMAMTEAYAKQYADKQLEIQMARMKIEKILKDETATDRERWKAIQEELNLTKKQSKELRKLYDAKEKAQKKDEKTRKAAEKSYNDYVNSIVNGFQKEGEAIGNMMNDAANAQYQAQSAFDGLTEGATSSAKAAGKSITKEVTKTAKELAEQLEDLMLEGMVDGIEKQIKQVVIASNRWVEKMKEARDKDLDNKDLYDKLIEEKEKQTQAKIDKIRDEGYKAISGNLKQITNSYNDLINGISSNNLSNLAAKIYNITNETEEKINALNTSIDELGKKIEELDKLNAKFDLSKFVEAFDSEDINNDFQNWLKENLTISDSQAEHYANAIINALKSQFEKNGVDAKVPFFEKIEGDEGALQKKVISLSDFFNILATSVGKSDTALGKLITSLQEISTEEQEIEKKRKKAGKDYENASKKRIGDNEKELILRKQLQKTYEESAQQNLTKLLEQAGRNALKEIPDTFTVYIDFQIENLELERAKLQDQFNTLNQNGDTEGANEVAKKIEEINNKLREQKTLLDAVSAANELEIKELKANSGTDLGFFDSQELMQNEVEIEKIRHQIEAVTQAREQGLELEGKVGEKERELAMERMRYNSESETMSEEEKTRAQERINARNEEIEALKREMAAIGYTGSEAMDKLLAELSIKMQSFSKQTTKIWQNNVKTVLSSFQQVTNSFSDLMNAIGEDNAEMTNFLEGLAYVNIGVNLAVAISEAVSSGAGMPFPYNLAAIAAGVAAVISAIASAISTYKQYHKQVSSPSFATGGVIGGRTARTREEGRRDDVPIWASKGEYVINADKVKEYGIDFFDAINFGKKMRKLNISGKYAEGGMINQTTIQQVTSQTPNYEGLVEALQSMPNPIVSVKEINSAQRKVKVAERLAQR